MLKLNFIVFMLIFFNVKTSREIVTPIVFLKIQQRQSFQKYNKINGKTNNLKIANNLAV